MPAKTTVMKFGGTSIEDGLAFGRVARIVSSFEGERLVIVVSAMSHVTDGLLGALQLAANGKLNEAQRLIDVHLERHLQLTCDIDPTSRVRVRKMIESCRLEIADLLAIVASTGESSASLEDMIASYGERLAAQLLAVVLEVHDLPAIYVDARKCILTDDAHGNAKPFLRETWQRTRREIEPLLEAKRVPVLGGFIAATDTGVTTTMGRGSSDYSATLVSAALGACETQIWTDVSGVLTADPRLVKSARTVPELSFVEAEELARFGVKVLHSKMIQPAAEQEIPVRIRNSRAPEEPGTLICSRTTQTKGGVKVIAHRTGMTTVDVTSTPALVRNGFMHTIKGISERFRISPEIVATSEIGVSLAYEKTSALVPIIRELQQIGCVEVREDRAVICCVGDGLEAEPANVLRLSNALKEVDSNITWGSTSGCNLISVFHEDCADAVIRRLHHSIFENNSVGNHDIASLSVRHG